MDVDEIGRIMAVLDDWCRKQALRTSGTCQLILRDAPGAIDSPEYRMALGQHQAFNRTRSFIHGALRARLLEQDHG